MNIEIKHFDLKKTFECGQCFRWSNNPDGSYTGVVNGDIATLSYRNRTLTIDSKLDNDFWIHYLDVNTDYDSLANSFKGRSDFLDICTDYGYGIRILNQDPWESLASFIFSQCNNIPRIKKIIEQFSKCFGEKIICGKHNYVNYSFPTPQVVCKLSPEDLAPLHSGYRAPYIIAAAKAVDAGIIDFEKLKKVDVNEASSELCKLYGVGKKVANCVVLFGLGHTEGFPIDTWMRKALIEYFPKDFNPESLGKYAGLAQQYIFYYSRENHIE